MPHLDALHPAADMSNRPLCFFHKNCMDGRASAAIVKRLEGPFSAMALQHGMKPLMRVAGRKVYILDFCFDLETMKRLKTEATELIWIDHHQTSVELSRTLGWGIVDESDCAAGLTWKTLFPGETEPPIIDCIRQRDLWTWKNDDARMVMLGLDAEYEGEGFDGILEVEVEHLKEIGRPQLKALRRRISQAIKHGVEMREPYGLRDVKALVLNNNRDLSDLGERVYLPEADGGLGYDLAIMFFLRGDGKWVHVLRSRTVDVERIASSRGGGGLKNAASYIAKMPFPYSDDCLYWPQ